LSFSLEAGSDFDFFSSGFCEESVCCAATLQISAQEIANIITTRIEKDRIGSPQKSSCLRRSLTVKDSGKL
jgi:hypothetical protein